MENIVETYKTSNFCCFYLYLIYLTWRRNRFLTTYDREDEKNYPFGSNYIVDSQNEFFLSILWL